MKLNETSRDLDDESIAMLMTIDSMFPKHHYVSFNDLVKKLAMGYLKDAKNYES